MLLKGSLLKIGGPFILDKNRQDIQVNFEGVICFGNISIAFTKTTHHFEAWIKIFRFF